MGNINEEIREMIMEKIIIALEDKIEAYDMRNTDPSNIDYAYKITEIGYRMMLDDEDTLEDMVSQVIDEVEDIEDEDAIDDAIFDLF